MGTASAPLWGILSGVVTIIGAIIVAKISGRSSENAAVEPIRLKAEQDAFKSAAEYWKETIEGLKSDVAALRADNARLEGKVDTLTAQSEANERKNKTRIRQLENELVAHNITVPEWEPAA